MMNGIIEKIFWIVINKILKFFGGFLLTLLFFTSWYDRHLPFSPEQEICCHNNHITTISGKCWSKRIDCGLPKRWTMIIFLLSHSCNSKRKHWSLMIATQDPTLVMTLICVKTFCNKRSSAESLIYDCTLSPSRMGSLDTRYKCI